MVSIPYRYKQNLRRIAMHIFSVLCFNPLQVQTKQESVKGGLYDKKCFNPLQVQTKLEEMSRLSSLKQSVSIPYRYKQNYMVEKKIFKGLQSFNPLQVQTKHTRFLSSVTTHKKFQSPIGTNKTILLSSGMFFSIGFQSPIGTNKTN